MIDAAVVLLAVALLLAVVGGIQPLAARLRLPPAVLLATFGIAIGAASSVLPRDLFDGATQLLGGLPISSETIIGTPKTIQQSCVSRRFKSYPF